MAALAYIGLPIGTTQSDGGAVTGIDTGTCATLELPCQDNTPGISCIIDDSYNATIWHSDHLDCDLLRLQDKHGRQDCLIHCGNFAGGRVTRHGNPGAWMHVGWQPLRSVGE
jgi:hypothetical protein